MTEIKVPYPEPVIDVIKLVPHVTVHFTPEQFAIVRDVIEERKRQDAKFPGQRVPVLPTGFDPLRGLIPPSGLLRLACDTADHEGRLSHMHIIAEEFAECLDERDPDKLDAELVQLTACCLKALEQHRVRAK